MSAGRNKLNISIGVRGAFLFHASKITTLTNSPSFQTDPFNFYSCRRISSIYTADEATGIFAFDVRFCVALTA
jgi:hypothetical protein